MAIFDFSTFKDEDEEELTPSQKAAEKVKKTTQKKKDEERIFNFSEFKRVETPQKLEVKQPEPVKKKTFIEKATEKVSGIAEKASKFLFGEKELISPIPRVTEAAELTDDEKARGVGQVIKFRQETEQQLTDAVRELDEFYYNVASGWAKNQKLKVDGQLGVTNFDPNRPRYYEEAGIPTKYQKEFYQKRKTVQALKLAIKDYDQFIANEPARRGVLGQIWAKLKYEGEETLIPFAKGNYDKFIYTKEREALEKYDQGIPLSSEEKRFIQTFRARAYNNLVDKGVGAAAGDVIVGIPKFAIEIYATSGAVNPITESLGAKITSSVAPQILKNIAPKLLKNSVQLALASNLNIPGISGATARYMLPTVDYEQALKTDDILKNLKRGDAPMDAKRKAYLTNLVEYVSEGVGNYIDDALPFVKKAFVGKWLDLNDIPVRPKVVTDALRNMHFNSLVGEVIEEEIGEPLQAAIEEREYQDPLFTPAGRERLLVETLGIGMFSGMARVSDSFFDQVKSYREKTGTDVIDLPVAEKPGKPAKEEVELPQVIKQEVVEKPEKPVEITVYRGSKGKVEKVTKSYDRVLEVETNQGELIKKLADEGNAKAKKLYESMPNILKPDFSIADPIIQAAYKGQYDVIQYNNQAPQLKAQGITYFELDTGQSFAELEATAENYAAQRREAKYEKPLVIPKELEPLAKEARKYKSAEEFIKEQSGTTTSGGYTSRGLNQAIEMRKSGGSLANYDNLSQKEWLGGKTPTKEITLYRATPNGENIKPGNYVTNDMAYAKQHIKDNLGGKGKITEIKATLDDIFPADGPKEFWYAPKEIENINLTDIYNQAKGVDPLIQEAKKYKSAEVFTKAQRQEIQKQAKEVIFSGETQWEARDNIDKFLTEVVKSPKTKFEVQKLKAVRAEIRRTMFKLVGADTGNWKRDYAYFQKLRNDPSLEPMIERIEEGIGDIDEIISKSEFAPKTAPGGFADVGGYADVESVEKHLESIPSVEMPELVRIARNLTGDSPSLKRFKTSLGMFYAMNQGVIKLDPKIFTKPDLAAKVLAHEVGHLSDYLEDKTMARGNLAGRIASLNKHLKDKFGNLSNKKLREELKSLTQLWKPFDETEVPESYVKYRYSSKELYADAISVLFNDPVLLKEKAPLFRKGFFEYLDKKPSVKTNFFKTWNLLNQEEDAVFQARDEELDKSFKHGEQGHAAKKLEKEKRVTSLLYQLQLLFDDKNTPIIKKVREAQKAGKIVDPKDNPEFALHGLNYTDGKLKNYVNDNFQPVFAKAQSVDDGWNTLGKILLLERVINERGELANPQGYDPKTAKKQLDMMEKHITKEEWKTLQEAKEGFRKAVQKSVDKAEKNKFYTPELLKQMKMNPAYATYQVIDYIDTYISAKVYQSVGTLKDVANPATSTVMKLISVEKAIERNNAKKLSIGFIQKNFPEEIEPAKTRWNGRFMQVRDPSDPDIGLVITIENGKPQGHYMSKDISSTLNYSSNREINGLVRVSRAISQSRFYRPLFTSFNLGFQSFNFVRDFMRYWKNVPDYGFGEAMTSLPRAVTRYAQATPHAAKRALNIKDDLIKEMENANILGLTYNDMFSSKEVDENRPQIERVMEKAGVLQNTKRNKLLTPFYWVLDSIETTANFIETLPKVAGYIELKGKMPEEQLAEFVRTSVGSPDFRIGGTATPVTNNIFLFSNAIKEGIKSDLRIAFTRNQSRAGFWWKTVASTFLPKMIMAGIAYGLFGDELKKILNKASEYDKTNYTIIPLGLDENKKGIYLRVPQDETGRFLGGILWKILNLNKDKKTIQDIFDIFAFGAGQFPNLSPSLTSTWALVTYLSGKNPYDSFRGRNVIPDKEFQAGPKYSWPIFAKWLAKNQGLGIFYPTQENYYNEQLTSLQKTLNRPVISNILGRWIKVSNYGETEEYRRTTQEVEKETAARLIEEKKQLDNAIKEYQSGSPSMSRKTALERKLVKELLGDPPYTATEKTKITNTKKKFRIGILRGEADAEVNAVISANTNDEKVTLLGEMKQSMDDKEFKDLMNKLLQYKVISKEVAREVRKK